MNGERPVLKVRLRGTGLPDGEIPLDDLARIAHETQTVVRSLARGLVGQRGPGRPEAAVSSATRLTLIGLHVGSTVLEIAGVVDAGDMLEVEGLPLDLGARALTLFADGVAALATQAPELPVGFDAPAVKDLDSWLRRVSEYSAVGLEATILGQHTSFELPPREARKRLRTLDAQPPIPFVNPTEQALEGTLYAVNLHTGTYSIQDDAAHTIRISVPEDLRGEAALHLGRRVRAIGRSEISEAGRLTAFTVSRLIRAPDLAALLQQASFFDAHELTAKSPPPGQTLDGWIIHGISEDDADQFLAALSE